MMVYIVTEGRYSDYHIERVYDNPCDAWKYYNTISKGNYPEVLVFDTTKYKNQDNTFKQYYVWRLEDGGKWHANEEADEYTQYCEAHGGGEEAYSVRAKDKAHALKIAQDRQAAWKAVQEGIA